MIILITLLVVAFLFLLSVTVLLLFAGPIMLLQPKRRKADFYLQQNHPVKPEDIKVNYENFELEVEKDLTLRGWIVKPMQEIRGTVIYLHGVGDCKIAGLPFAEYMSANGYQVVIYDSRRHGESAGKFCTYGFYEKYDLIKMIDFLKQKYNINSVGLFGTSMGAAVALQTAAMDTRIKAVISENSFSTLRKIFDDYQKRIIKIPFHYLRNLVITRSEFIANFKAREVSPLDAVKKIKVPILFVVSKQDKHINPKYTYQLYENTPGRKELYIIENATHIDAWDLGGDEYHQKILNFFRENL